MKGLALQGLERQEDAIAIFDQAFELTHSDDTNELKENAVTVLYLKSMALRQLGRLEEAIVAIDQVLDFVHSDSPLELRDTAVLGLNMKGLMLDQLERYEDAIGALDQVLEFIDSGDPIELREKAVMCLNMKGLELVQLERHEDAITTFDQVHDFTHSDDPMELDEKAMMFINVKAFALQQIGRLEDAEAAFRSAAEIRPNGSESWNSLAWNLLLQNDDARQPEAEEHARHAVELDSSSSSSLHTLSDVLARRNKWAESIDCLDRAVREGGKDWCETVSADLTRSFIVAATAGHAQEVKDIMKEADLNERMEPLWHAIRVELGEKLEPLPAEILDAIKEVRRRIAEPQLRLNNE